jgi:hypothetical protein
MCPPGKLGHLGAITARCLLARLESRGKKYVPACDALLNHSLRNCRGTGPMVPMCAAALYEVNCQSTACNQDVVITLPANPSEYGLTMQAGYVGCCNHEITSYYVVSGCETAKLRDPAVRKTILATLSTQHLLVANCKGLYFPMRANQLFIDPALSWNAASSFRKASADIAR